MCNVIVKNSSSWSCWELLLLPQRHLLKRTNLTTLKVRLIYLVMVKVLTMAVSIFIQLYEMELLPAGSEILLMHSRLQTLLPYNSLQLDFDGLRYMRNNKKGIVVILWILYIFSSSIRIFLQYSQYYFDNTETDFPPRRSVLYRTDNHHITCCDLFFVGLFACFCRLNF